MFVLLALYWSVKVGYNLFPFLHFLQWMAVCCVGYTYPCDILKGYLSRIINMKSNAIINT